MKTGFSMNSGIVNWPEIKTRRIRLSPAMSSAREDEATRERSVLHVVASNLEQFKHQVVQTLHRL